MDGDGIEPPQDLVPVLIYSQPQLNQYLPLILGAPGRSRTCKSLLLKQERIPIPSQGHLNFIADVGIEPTASEDMNLVCNHYTCPLLVLPVGIEPTT